MRHFERTKSTTFPPAGSWPLFIDRVGSVRLRKSGVYKWDISVLILIYGTFSTSEISRVTDATGKLKFSRWYFGKVKCNLSNSFDFEFSIKNESLIRFDFKLFSFTFINMLRANALLIISECTLLHMVHSRISQKMLSRRD